MGHRYSALCICTRTPSTGVRAPEHASRPPCVAMRHARGPCHGTARPRVQGCMCAALAAVRCNVVYVTGLGPTQASSRQYLPLQHGTVNVRDPQFARRPASMVAPGSKHCDARRGDAPARLGGTTGNARRAIAGAGRAAACPHFLVPEMRRHKHIWGTAAQDAIKIACTRAASTVYTLERNSNQKGDGDAATLKCNWPAPFGFARPRALASPCARSTRTSHFVYSYTAT